MNRREFTELLLAAGLAGILPARHARAGEDIDYQLPAFGNARLLHMTDCHAQLSPVYYREPSVNIGVGNAAVRPPHLVGEAFLRYFKISPGGPLAHAFTSLDFVSAAHAYGKVGGFAHLASLIGQLRAQAGDGNSLLLDGGDTWQGSAGAYWSGGREMVEATNLLGVDVTTGHWEFTYPEETVRENIARMDGEFLAHNVFLTEEAAFDDAPAYDADSGQVFKPYTVRSVAGQRVAIVGQAFPYTPIANPSRFIPDWRFGIREQALQALVNKIRAEEEPAAVVLLSHNGFNVDLKLASRVSGIDVILGGHTHDAVPAPMVASNPGGQTLVTNAGSNGKFLGVLDLDLRGGKMRGHRYRLLPVFANALPEEPRMAALIRRLRAPHAETLGEALAVTETLLYRRGNFNGTFDQLICDALRQRLDAQVALSPGFRWGTSVLPGEAITFQEVMNQTCITYPETYVRDMTGAQIREILEDVADNLFNADPYYQQGGDMVRTGGIHYRLSPSAESGKRISAVTVAGAPLDAGRSYRVAGWATVSGKAPGPAVWDVVADYLRDHKTIRIDQVDQPSLVG